MSRILVTFAVFAWMAVPSMALAGAADPATGLDVPTASSVPAPVSLASITALGVKGENVSLASTSDTGVKGNDNSFSPSLNSAGRKVAFYSEATNLDPLDLDFTTDIYMKNLATGDITLASTSTGGTKSNGSSVFPDLAA